MNRYNDQYYIVFKSYDENTLYLSALQKSADRDYGFYKLDLNDEPLYFENAYKEKDKKNGVLRPIKSAHMNMGYVVINTELKELVEPFDIENVQLYPSIIIDDKEEFYEGYWLINVYRNLDCLDFNSCIIEDYDPQDDFHDILKYSFSEKKLDLIPEEKRLILEPEKSDMAYTFFHQKIVDIFLDSGVTNLRFFKVSDWEAGKEFR